MSLFNGVLNKAPSLRESAAADKRMWRDFLERPQNGDDKTEIHIGLAASFTSNSLVPFLGAYLLKAGIRPSINPGHYNQIFQACLDPTSQFGTSCDTIIVIWRLEDLLLDEILAFSQGETEAYQRALANVSMLVSAIGSLRANFTGTMIISVPPFPTDIPTHLTHLENPRIMGALYRNLTNIFVEKIGAIRDALLFDCDALQRNFGLSVSHDPRQWYLYRQPFTELFLAEMGSALGRIIVARRHAPKKCIVLDCDNTLWGGIVGEDGVSGIKIGDDFPGSAFRDFQRLLLHWRRQGVLLALASKNNEEDVWEVFDKHNGMVLKREHIAAWQINWNPKADNLRLIAKTLNIGVDSLVLVDDNPMEIAYIRASCPDAVAVQIPDDPADILTEMHRLSYFDRLEITKEDRQRTDMVRSEQVRENLGKSLSKEEFLNALDLKNDFFEAKADELDRITQLINKTNQFNLTTIRRTLDEVRTLAGGPSHRVFGLRVTDKFGDYGLTGVVIVEISSDRKQWILDTLLLSCRVLGRGVETYLVNILVEKAKGEGAFELIGSFVPTAKNSLAASFLQDHGFVSEGSQRWSRLLG